MGGEGAERQNGFLQDNNNNNVHLSCAHQRPDASHDMH